MRLTRRELLAVAETIRTGILVPVATTRLVTELHAAFERAATLGPMDPLIGQMVQDALGRFARDRGNNIAGTVQDAIDEVRREERAGR